MALILLASLLIAGRLGPENTESVNDAGVLVDKDKAPKAKELLIGKWKCELNGTTYFLDFTEKEVTYRSKFKDMKIGGTRAYMLTDGKTIKFVNAAGNVVDEFTIVSITKEKLVLSGGKRWMLDKAEFVK